MKAAEIRRSGIPAPGNAIVDGSSSGENLALVAGALQEIAAQLAELNEKLEPARLVKAITEIQAEIEKQERELGIKS